MRNIFIFTLIFSSLLSLCSCQVCNNLLGGGLTEIQKKALVDKHNELREKVAKGEAVASGGITLPSSKNMKKIVWDETLATVAQSYANKCPWLVHNAQRTSQTQNLNSDAIYSYIGENMYFMRTSSAAGKVSFPTPVDSWFNEITSFIATQISPFKFTSGTGHFTQVAWADTTRIGCGYAYEYNTTLSTTFTYVHYVVCDYAKGGNWLNDVMYQPGTACSACESGICDTTYPHLCLPGYGQLLLDQTNQEEQAPVVYEEVKSEPVSQIQISSDNTQENQEQNQKHRKSYLKRDK